MLYSDKTNSPIKVLRGLCYLCGKKTSLQLRKEERSGCIWIIPYWGTDYFITCGNCFKTIKINDKLATDIIIGVYDNKPLVLNQNIPKDRRGFI